MSTCRRIKAHKFNAKCPIKGCTYQSRIPYLITDPNPYFGGLNNQNSCHSQKCPKHRTELIKI